MKFSKVIYGRNLAAVLIFGLLLSSCGVKGDPTPPVNPVYIGTGKYIKQSEAKLLAPSATENINKANNIKVDKSSIEIIKTKKVKKKKQ
ncbi:MAG: lipoprotein [Bdellovibrionales bacterium]